MILLAYLFFSFSYIIWLYPTHGPLCYKHDIPPNQIDTHLRISLFSSLYLPHVLSLLKSYELGWILPRLDYTGCH